MKNIAFAEMEHKIFEAACKAARAATKQILEKIDTDLAGNRDKKQLRDKGRRKTTVKTIYGEVEYKRHMYKNLATGETVYLVDKNLLIKKTGLLSENLTEKIICAASETSYRQASRIISEISGQNISHAAVWKAVNNVGTELTEKQAALKIEEEPSEYKKDRQIIFEEMDGVWVPMQDKAHKKAKKQEIKVATIHEGWNAENPKKLKGRTFIAAIEPSRAFCHRKEAVLSTIYNTDEIKYRILNSDGGAWIHDSAANTVSQLDKFHVLKAITSNIRDKKARRDITDLYKSGSHMKMIEYIRIYADSVASDGPGDDRSRKALVLYNYLFNNIDGLKPWQFRLDGRIPDPPKGIIYKNGGCQESQNCTLITMRMKHRRMRWSERGANALLMLMCCIKNGDLKDVLRHGVRQSISAEVTGRSAAVLSATKVRPKAGRADIYADLYNNSVPLLDAAVDHTAKMLRSMIAGNINI